MAIVHFSMSVPAVDGTPVPASGSLQFTPTARRVISGAPDVVVLPKPFTVPLIAGLADVTLAPTSTAWAWRVDEYLHGVAARTVYVVVPTAIELDYPDLIAVDPSTLEPAAIPEPVWVAQLAGKVDVSTVGAALGVAPLGVDSKVPESYLPTSSVAGPAGPQGPKGDTGATGPAGSNATATTNASDLTAGTLADARLPATSNAAAVAAKADASALTAHTGNVSNPHAVTKAQVGLGNVDNTSDANKPLSAVQAAMLTGVASPLQTGLFYAGVHTGTTTVLMSANSLRGSRLIVGRACTLTSITAEVTVAGTAGAVVRLGLYKLDSAGNATLLVDAGTIDGTTTGVKTLTISQAVAVGDSLILVAGMQGGATTQATLRANTGADPFIGAASATISPSQLGGYQVSGITGALPSTPTLSAAGGGTVPRVLVSAAA